MFPVTAPERPRCSSSLGESQRELEPMEGCVSAPPAFEPPSQVGLSGNLKIATASSSETSPISGETAEGADLSESPSSASAAMTNLLNSLWMSQPGGMATALQAYYASLQQMGTLMAKEQLQVGISSVVGQGEKTIESGKGSEANGKSAETGGKSHHHAFRNIAPATPLFTSHSANSVMAKTNGDSNSETHGDGKGLLSSKIKTSPIIMSPTDDLEENSADGICGGSTGGTPNRQRKADSCEFCGKVKR